MDGLRDELFAREEEEAIIVDDAHVVTDSDYSQTDSESQTSLGCSGKAFGNVR